MKRLSVVALTAVLSAVLSGPALGADSPATLPTTVPVVPPYVMSVPRGMQEITVEGRSALAPPQFAQAVQTALAKIKPATMPSTQASDVLANLDNVKANLAHEMAGDLAVPEDKVTAFISDSLRPALAAEVAIHPHCYVLVCTQDELTAATSGGWNSPLFHYNRLANHTFYRPRIVVSGKGPMDDVILWSEAKAGESAADIARGVTLTIGDFDSGFAEGLSQDALGTARTKLVGFISDNVVTPLKLPGSEQWFGLGLMGSLSSKYMALITGERRAALAAAASADTPANPLHAAPLDLLHEFDPDAVKPDFLVVYLDAVSRKATGVMEKLLEKAGDGSVVKILAAIRATPPADNDALVSLIQNVTGVDLTNDLLPHS